MKNIIRKILKEEVSEKQEQYHKKLIDILTREGFVGTSPYQHILKYLKNSKNKFFFISTGTNQEEIKKICKKKKISNYFSGIFGSPKNKIDHINFIIKKNKINKNDVLFVGDSMSDYRAAKSCGISFVCKSNSENKNLFKNSKIKRIYKFKQLYNF